MSDARPAWLVAAPGLFVLLWSLGHVAAKFGLGYIEPLTFLALRFACVVVIMTVLFALLRPPLPATRAQWLHLAVVGFFLQAVYFGMCYLSFDAGLALGTLGLVLKRFGGSHHPVTANLVGFTAGLAGVLPFALAQESMTSTWSLPLSGSLASLIVGSSLLAVGLLLAMLHTGDVSRVSALFCLVPPLAAAFAWMVLDEAMPPVAWLGMAVAAVGVFVATTAWGPTKPSNDQPSTSKPRQS